MIRLRLQRADRLLLVVLILASVLVALLVVLVLPPESDGGGFVQLPTTFHSDAGGTKAMLYVLQDLGFTTAQLRRPISSPFPH